eukprot:Hpha_TRINITY_DN4072_c0_g1::TRINITY_DN4072_c0_g1_i1::g.63633::m.63633
MYFLRPLGWVMKAVLQKYELFLQRNGGLGSTLGFGNGPCAVVHVRRADITLGGKPHRYVPVARYIEELKVFPKAHPIIDILLMTDDANAVREAQTDASHRWLTVERSRFNGSEGGWENHFPSRSPSEEVINILLLFKLVRRCRAGFVGSMNSAFSKLLFDHSCWDLGKWSCPPFASIHRHGQVKCDNCSRTELERVPGTAEQRPRHRRRPRRDRP